MNDIVFDLKNIDVYYRKAASLPWRNPTFQALRDVSFQVQRGQTLGIIGRNGAGKSTLLKILAGIILPDAGHIHRADVSVTMQSLGAGFDPRLTGRQNIILNGLLLGMEKNHIRRRIQDIVDLADIKEFMNEPVKHYSAGMKTRLGFAIAYYADTDVILIDEAFVVGDQAFKEKASVLIKEKIKSDCTVVLVTHSMPLVTELCDRVIQLESGHPLSELNVQESVGRYLNLKNKGNEELLKK